MIRFIRLATFLLAVFILASNQLSAQVPIGLPPFGSFSGGPDVINNANLNVHWEVPVVSKYGRGLGFHYSLSNDTSVWYPSVVNGTNTWTPVSNNGTNTWGWRALTEAALGFVSYSTSTFGCRDQYGELTQGLRYTNWVYHDPAGTLHPYTGMILDDGNTPCRETRQGLPYTPTFYATMAAPDGSGFTLDANTSGGAPDPSTTSLYDRSGDVITPMDLQTGSGGATETDPTRNTVLTGGGTTFTDSLGDTELTISGNAPNPTIFAYLNPSGGTSNVTVNYTLKTVETNFGCSGVTEFGATQRMTQYLISSIGLPDGTSYSISYEPTYNPNFSGAVTGRIQSITLPTGGTITNNYNGPNHGVVCSDGSASGFTRQTLDGTWTYTRTLVTGSQWTTTITSPSPANNKVILNFQGLHETSRQVKQSGSTLLSTIYTCYSASAGTAPPTPPCDTTSVSPTIARRAVTVATNNGLQAKTETFYNAYGLPYIVDEYAYGNGSVGSLQRETMTCYANFGDLYIEDHPSNVMVYSATGNPTNCTGTTGLVAQASYTYNMTYGTPLTESHSTGGTPATISRSFSYSTSGVEQSQTDYNGITTSYTNFACNGAFPGTTNLPISLSTSASWNCNVGLPNSVSDVNGNATTFGYDNMVRLTSTSFPDGGSVSTTYTSATLRDIYTAITGSLTRHDQVGLDGLGRVTSNILVNDPDGQTDVNTTYGYDSTGQTVLAGNPYRTSSTGGDTYQYDALNRVNQVTHADSSVATITYGGGTAQSCAASTYGYGYSIVYTDEVGKKHQTFTDALGRIIETDEPDSNDNPTVYTCYKYDLLNDLTEVDQGSLTRKYTYDKLGRLTSAQTPEAQNNTRYLYYTTSGATLCSGDPTAVCRRTDERGVTTTYTYDALNRLTGISYSNGDASAGYAYDQASYNGLSISNGKGRRTGMADASGRTAWSYDKMGRVWAEERTIGSFTNTLDYTYNLDGSLSTVTYPSGRMITYTPSAVGRPLSAQDLVNNINYATSATYAPQGALATANYGSNIAFSAGYNNRLWPNNLQGATLSPSATIFQLQPAYNTNGTVSGVTHPLNISRTESFGYDNLNRIIWAQSGVTSGQYCWAQSFTYDRYGNLEMSNTATGQGCASLYGTTLPSNGYNQLGQPYSYDAAGNMTADGTYSYTWNGEGLLKSAGSVNYTHDGDGKRVEKSSGTYYWFSPSGAVLAETNSSGALLNEYIYFSGGRAARRDSSGNVYYYVGDHLGTARLITNASGTVCYDADYAPFGQEIAFTNTCSQNYKFTGMERDAETANDHTWYRGYEWNIGRWMSPDPLAGDVTDPQSLNRYTYVLNNPTRLIDPLGLDFTISVTVWAPLPVAIPVWAPSPEWGIGGGGGHFAPLLDGGGGGGWVSNTITVASNDAQKKQDCLNQYNNSAIGKGIQFLSLYNLATNFTSLKTWAEWTVLPAAKAGAIGVLNSVSSTIGGTEFWSITSGASAPAAVVTAPVASAISAAEPVVAVAAPIAIVGASAIDMNMNAVCSGQPVSMQAAFGYF